VRARGAAFHVAEAGPADGPAVVLLHGWPQHWYEWRDCFTPLADAGLRVIAPDLRGFGWSERTRHGYRKGQLAADVLAVLDRLGVKEFRLAGHDWGGYVAFLLGLYHPDRVQRLLLVNTGHGFVKRDLKTLRAQAGFWYMPLIGTPGLGPALVRSGAISAAMARMSEVEGVWDADTLRWFMERTDPHTTQQVYGSFVMQEAPRALFGGHQGLRLKPPTLFLHGDADPAIRPDMIRGLEDHADDYRLELLPGLGHFCIEQAPEVVVPKLVKFLTA
jgi:pimeloyl-ACP methyl ester carboxylesterase